MKLVSVVLVCLVYVNWGVSLGKYVNVNVVCSFVYILLF